MRLLSCKPYYGHYLSAIRYACAVVIFLILFITVSQNLWASLSSIIWLVAAFLAIAVALSLYLKITNDAITYEITDRELVKHEGIFIKRSAAVPFDKISNVITRRDMLQRIFGLGTIFIDTTGAGPNYEMTIKNVQLSEMNKLTAMIRDMIDHAHRKERGEAEDAALHLPDAPWAPQAGDGEKREERKPEAKPAESPAAAELKRIRPMEETTPDGPRTALEDLEYKAYVRQRRGREDEEDKDNASAEEERERPAPTEAEIMHMLSRERRSMAGKPAPRHLHRHPAAKKKR